MSKTKVIGLNTDADGNARCIKAGYFKMGVAIFLHHPNDGLTATCVIEIEIEDEELHLLRIESRGKTDENGKNSQHLEINSGKYSNAITSVQKDYLVIEYEENRRESNRS